MSKSSWTMVVDGNQQLSQAWLGLSCLKSSEKVAL